MNELTKIFAEAETRKNNSESENLRLDIQQALLKVAETAEAESSGCNDQLDAQITFKISKYFRQLVSLIGGSHED